MVVQVTRSVNRVSSGNGQMCPFYDSITKSFRFPVTNPHPDATCD